MKTYTQFLDEALAGSLVRAAARGVVRNRGTLQRVQRSTGAAPRTISRTRLYHGTNQPSSQAINRSGWRTDTNVTRQMTGSGVYTTPQRPAAQMYANQRSVQRGGAPAVRTFSIPTSTYQRVKAQRQAAGQWQFEKGGQRFNAMQMSPQAANRYDITNRPLTQTIRPQGPQKTELRQRVNTALRNPRNRSVLRRDIRSTSGMRSGLTGMSSSLSTTGSPSGATGRFQVGGSQGYGIGDTRLAT